MRADLRCWSGVLKALGHTVVNYSQDGPQSVVDVPLVDEFRLMIDPVLVDGKRLFRDDRALRTLRLVDTR